MKLQKAMIFTFAAALVSYGVSYLGMRMSGYDKKSFPEAVVIAYAKSSGEAKDIKIDRTLEVKGVEQLEVGMTSTDIYLKKSPDEKMHVKLTGLVGSNTVDLKTEQVGSKMVVELREDEKKERKSFINFTSEEGDMEVLVPAGVKKLILRTVSGDVELAATPFEDVELRTVSGDIGVHESAVKKVLWQSVSGDLDLTSPVESFDGRSVSGDFEIESSVASPNIAASSTSGDMTIKFAVAPDLKVNFRSVSGDASIETAALRQEGSGNLMVDVGSGKGTVTYKTTSGDLTIQQ